MFSRIIGMKNDICMRVAKYMVLRSNPKQREIQTHLTWQEKRLLLRLVKVIQKRSPDVLCVEIGSYIGASAELIASQIINGKLFCIDTWNNEGMTEGLRDTWTEFQNNTRHLEDRIIPVRGFSYDVVGIINGHCANTRGDKCIDLLFIDGDHSYEGVKKDWDLYSPILQPNSIVIFHDYGWAEGVQKVVQQDALPYSVKHGKLPNLFWIQIK